MWALGCSSSSSVAKIGPRTVPLTITWSAWISPWTTAASEMTSMLGSSVMARMSPTTSPSTRRPSVNFRLPSTRLPWAMRLLMGGCAFLPNILAPLLLLLERSSAELDALHCPGGRSLEHLGGHVLYHGLLRQVDHAFQAAVLAELQALAATGHFHAPRL